MAEQCPRERPGGDAVRGPGPLVLARADAVASPDPLAQLMASALGWMIRVHPARVAIFYPVDRRLKKFTCGPIVVSTSALDLSDVASALRKYATRCHLYDPFAPRRFAEAFSPVVDDAAVGRTRELERSMFEREFLALFGAAHQTTMYLRVRGRIAAGADLLGGPEEPLPGSRELALLRTGHGLLEHAYACVDAQADPETRVGSMRLDELTEREAEVAQLVAQGASNAEVARTLHLSPATVKSHLVRVFAKLDVGSRTQLAILMQQGSAAGQPAARGRA